MSVSTIGVVQESAEGERRVALSPDGVGRLRKAGHEVLVETGAGAGAWFPDAEYEAAGARLLSKNELYGRADAVLWCRRRRRPTGAATARVRCWWGCSNR